MELEEYGPYVWSHEEQTWVETPKSTVRQLGYQSSGISFVEHDNYIETSAIKRWLTKMHRAIDAESTYGLCNRDGSVVGSSRRVRVRV